MLNPSGVATAVPSLTRWNPNGLASDRLRLLEMRPLAALPRHWKRATHEIFIRKPTPHISKLLSLNKLIKIGLPRVPGSGELPCVRLYTGALALKGAHHGIVSPFFFSRPRFCFRCSRSFLVWLLSRVLPSLKSSPEAVVMVQRRARRARAPPFGSLRICPRAPVAPFFSLASSRQLSVGRISAEESEVNVLCPKGPAALLINN